MITNMKISLRKKYLSSTFKDKWYKDKPSVEDLVKSGFFYSGSEDIVICSYCQLSLYKWEKNDNVDIEHKKYSPHCKLLKYLENNYKEK